MDQVGRFRHQFSSAQRYLRSHLVPTKSEINEPPVDPRTVKLHPLKPSPEEFARLEPVQHQLVDFLYVLRPVLVVSLSKWHYDHYVPKLYRDVILGPNSFVGLFRAYGRGVPFDNNTIRAYKHTETLHLFDVTVGHNLSTVSCGDQPVYVPHSQLFENVKKLEIDMEIFLLQADEELYYLYRHIASHVGKQLDSGTFENLVIGYNGRSDVSTIDKALDGWTKNCKPKTITLIVKPRVKPGGELELPDLPVDQAMTKLLRVVVTPAPEAGSLNIEDIQRYISRLASSPRQQQKIRQDNGIKVEIHMNRAEDMRKLVISRLNRVGEEHAVAWVGVFVEFCELDEEGLGLGWSDLWAEAKGENQIGEIEE